MPDNLTENRTGKKYQIHQYYILGIVIISIILIILRIMFFISPLYSEFAFLRDVDYRTLHDLHRNGLVGYYDGSSIAGFRAIYLYYWYFFFYPFYLLPISIGVYVWDVLRLITSIYIAKNIYRITEDATEIIIFFILCGIGYFADMYLNNTNWLIQFLLFESYIQLEKDNKWVAGLLFALAMYKINLIIFPLVLLITKRIKWKELVYFLLPLFLLCLPYLIFPEYFFKLLHNWTYVEEGETASTPLIIRLYLIMWQAFQPAQLMFMALLFMIFLVNLENEVWRIRLRWIIFILLILINLSFPLILWPLT